MLHWLNGAFRMMYKEAYKRKCEPTLVFIQTVGLRLPCRWLKKKQLTPLAIYVDIHITHQRKNVLYLFLSTMSCRSSPFRNKAKTLPIYMSVAITTIQR